MKLETKKISGLPPEATYLLKIVATSGALDAGGWIGGGFARQIAHHVLLKEKDHDEWMTYLSPDNRYGTTRPGDVDVFLPKKTTKFDDEIAKLQNSFAGFAKNMKLYGKGKEFPGSTTIQFITDPAFRYDSVADCLQAFDLYNSRYALVYIDSGRFVLHWDPKALEVDRMKRVSIVQTKSPFLGSRVLKYIQNRGCTNGIDPESHELMLQWLIRAGTDAWPDTFAKQHIDGVKNQVIKLRDAGHIEADALALFINKWTIQVKTGSGYQALYKEVDWAMDQIEKAAE